MTYYQVAQLIPAKYRQQILQDNVIFKAVAKGDDVQMRMLVIYYQNYINPGMEPVNFNNPCLACLTDILQQFKILEPFLVELEKQFKLLDAA